MTAPLRRILSDGFLGGSIAYATVATFFVATNLAQGRAWLHTPALLGGWLFFRTADPVVEAGPVLLYNGAHLLACLALGVLAAVVVARAERNPAAFAPAFVLLLGAFAAALSLLLAVTTPISEALPAWSIISANVLAFSAMTGFLVWRHPRLRAQARLHPVGDPQRPGVRPPTATGDPPASAIDFLIWATAEPAAGHDMASGASPRTAGFVGTRFACCALLSRDVRVRWTPALESDDARPHADAVLACLDFGTACTNPICPLFVLSSATMAQRLRRTAREQEHSAAFDEEHGLQLPLSRGPVH
jgi:hypothetical protein